MNRIDNHLPTEEMQALDAAHHMHPFTANEELGQKGARIITQAKGSFVTDSEGVNILDAMAGLWCVNIGYGRKELAEVANAQMQQLPYYNTFFQTSHPPVIDLAARLARLAPAHMNNTFFAGSGSEANDTNIRLVRQYWAIKGKPNKKTIISRYNAYHGSSMGSASLGGMKAMHAQGGMPIPDITHIDQPYWYGEGGDMSPAEFGLMRAHALEVEIDRLGEDNVAAFIAEPIQGAGAVIIPPETYWPEIQRICDEREILLIADEVICGFGRAGKWFASETLNIRADVMTIAKGLSSGYIPIGGSMVSDEVASVIGSSEFAHGYTYSGHPVACAVALENLRILEEEKIVDYVHNDIGPYLAAKWATLADHPLVGDARIIGMMGALELSPDKANRARFAAEGGVVGLMCRDRCFANELIMRCVGDTMIISPPLVLTREEADMLVERAARSLDETLAQLKSNGMMVAA